MSGIGGWIGAENTQASDRFLALCGEALGGGNRNAVRSWRSISGGLMVADCPQATHLVTLGEQSVAIFGSPRWMENGRPVVAPAEVCRKFLEAYRARKAVALEFLHGDFALAVVDSAADEVMLAIDRVGIRSLVYQEDDAGLIFGSSCDIVCMHPNGSNEINLQSIYDYAYFHAVPGPKTIYRKQNRLLPGYCMTWSRGRKSLRPYWSMKFVEQTGSVADFKPGLLQVLRDAVTTASNGANCGAFLSGGTDSSTVAGMLCNVSGSSANTYSIGFAVDGYDEMDYARIASRHFGTTQHEYYVTPDDVLSALPAIAGAYDQPFGNASAVAAYYCARMAKKDGMTRLLAGDGGDELFGGNSRYAKQYQLAYYDRIPAAIRKVLTPMILSANAATSFALLRKMRSYIEQASRPMPSRYDSYNLIDRLGPQNLFTREFLSSVDRDVPIQLLRKTYKNYDHASLINQMLGIDLKFTLADNDLPKVTRMCELAGIEVAFPLLDESVVAFSAHLPACLKLRGTKLRYFFKEALRGFLPDEILRKEKHGFGLPVGAWITTHPGLKALTGDSLSSLKGRGIIAPAFIDRLLDEHLKSHAAYFGTMAWVLMMLELWFQKHPSATMI